jgi:hypothetical protein
MAWLGYRAWKCHTGYRLASGCDQVCSHTSTQMLLKPRPGIKETSLYSKSSPTECRLQLCGARVSLHGT